jgi:hypothetical protein
MAIVIALLPAVAAAQSAAPDASATAAYVPITPRGRLTWVGQGSTSVASIAATGFGAALGTLTRWPSEWPRTIAGFGQRYADAAATGTISDAIEAGMGALWGEDPRYRRSTHTGPLARLRHVVAQVPLAPRSNGHPRPAWARLTATVGGNLIENTWLPASVTTPRQTTYRIADGFASRLLGNLWQEFWPDARQRLRRHGTR